MENIKYHIFSHKFGLSLLAWKDEKVICHIFDTDNPLALLKKNYKAKLVEENKKLPQSIKSTKAALKDYFSGNKVQFKVSDLDLQSFGEFQKEVYKNLIKIKTGKTLSYKDLAEKSNSPKAARAVGSCMARNPFPVIIPCHRVLPQNKKIGAYSSSSGPKMKIKLLEHEGVTLN